MSQQALFWDQRATQYDQGIQQHDGAYAQTIAATAAYLTPADHVLDLGCASGELTLDLAPHVAHLHGVDVSGKMIKLARSKVSKRQVDNVSFGKANISDLTRSSSSFTAIIAFNILHLVENPKQTVTRLGALLEEGGLLITKTPCLSERNWLLRTVLRGAYRLGIAPPIRSFTHRELQLLISRSQFEIVEAKLWDEANKVHWIVARKVTKTPSKALLLL